MTRGTRHNINIDVCVGGGGGPSFESCLEVEWKGWGDTPVAN